MDRVYVMELVRSFQVGELNRRQFLTRATAALGSVALANTLLAACTPVSGPTAPVVEPPAAGGSVEEPPPSASGLITDTVTYPDEDGETLMGYLARPADDQAHQAVIVIQEWWGVNENIKDIVRRYATEGFVALAPDLYHGVVVSEPNEARKLVMELDMDEAVREIQQAVGFLLAQTYVAGPRVGLTGFCMGGRLVLMTALVENDLGAVIPYYGSPLSVEQTSQVKAPLQGHYGSQDGGIPVSAVRAMEEGLNEAGIPNEIYIYEGAQHSFFNDTRPSYDAEASALAWERTLAWLRQHLS